MILPIVENTNRSDARGFAAEDAMAFTAFDQVARN